MHPEKKYRLIIYRTSLKKLLQVFLFLLLPFFVLLANFVTDLHKGFRSHMLSMVICKELYAQLLANKLLLLNYK